MLLLRDKEYAYGNPLVKEDLGMGLHAEILLLSNR